MTHYRLPYSTVAGYVTRGETFAQLLDQLRQATDCTQRMSTSHWTTADYALLDHHITLCEEASNVLGHLHKTEGDARSVHLGTGWLGIGEMFHNLRQTFRILATAPHLNRWAKVKLQLEKVTWHITQMHEAKLQ